MSYLSQWAPRNRFTPGEIHDKDSGLRPSVAKLIKLIDMDDPSFAKTASILSDMAAAGVELDESAIAIALKMSKVPDPDSRPGKPHLTPDEVVDLGLPMWDWGKGTGQQAIVYYVRRGQLIKIGTTTRPAKRFEALMPDEIMAFEPGGRQVEAARHRQFHHLRQGREHFAKGDDLIRHVKRIRTAHGAPDPAWRTTANLADINRHVLPLSLPAPVSTETATATEAVALLGISMGTVYGWIRRKKIRRVGMNDWGRDVYYVEHFRVLAASHKPRRS